MMAIQTNNLNEEIKNLRQEISLIQKNNLLKLTDVHHESSVSSEAQKAAEDMDKKSVQDEIKNIQIKMI